jgi:multidrug efflux pump subunit AcrA (membrane-fusion protein)
VAASVRLQREAAVKARTFLWLLAIAGAGVLTWALLQLRSRPPEVQFVPVTRDTIHNSVVTNGKVEPIEWATARAERSGPVEKILIQRGQNVAKDAPLVELDATEARASFAAAEARIAQAQADLDLIRRGGRATDLADISAGLDLARHDFETAKGDYDIAKRLLDRQAGTKIDVEKAKERMDRAQLQIQSFEQRRSALTTAAPDRAAAQARLDDAKAAQNLAETQIRQSAPIDGTVYQFDLKPGAYLNAGDVIATIGRLDRVRVTVYVDEPDLGRVAKAMPVVITWDALPGKQWSGEVDKTPTQIVPLGTRQVGEVACVIQNPDRELLPGTNVTVEIRAQTVPNILTLPKETVHTEHGQTGVYVLTDDHLEWKQVTLGVSNTTRTEVNGLKEGEEVAISSDHALRNGLVVRAVVQ